MLIHSSKLIFNSAFVSLQSGVNAELIKVVFQDYRIAAAHILIVILTLGVLSISELMKRETKDKYNKHAKKNNIPDWKNVYLKSLLAGLFVGVFSGLTLCSFVGYDYWLLGITGAITTITYLSVQTYMTDTKILLVDRRVLRIGYLLTMAFSVFMYYTNPQLNANLYVFIGTYIAILFLFFGLPQFGASDVRAIAVTLPISTMLMGVNSLLVFVGVLLLVMFVISAKQKYGKDKIPVPVALFFLAPYIFVLFIYPFAI